MSKQSAQSVNTDFWDAIDLPSNSYDTELDRAYKSGLDAIQSGPDQGWLTRGSKELVDIYTRSMSDSPYEQIKGVGFMEGVTPEEIIELFIDPDHRQEHDPTAATCKVVQEIDRLTRIEYSTFKAPWPVSFRDLLAVGRVKRFENGALLNYATSIQLDSMPPVSGMVRAELEFYALLVTPVQPGLGGRPRCHVVLVASTNPGGALPGWVTNASQLNQPLGIALAQKFVNNRPDLINRIREGLPLHYAAFGFPGIPRKSITPQQLFQRPITPVVG